MAFSARYAREKQEPVQLPAVEQDVVGVQEALRSYQAVAQAPPAVEKEAEYPSFLLIQPPSADYVEEVRQRRLRLMAQEKARRQARLRRQGYAVEPEASVEPVVPEVAARVDEVGVEERAQSAFAARVARVAREHPGSVGERQVEPESRPSVSSRPDFSGSWVDDQGTSYQLLQSGSMVTEREQQSCGMAMGKELTMFGAIGSLREDLIHWSDGRIWARQQPEKARVDATALGGFAWKRRSALAPELAELFQAGPEVGGHEARAAEPAGEQRRWFAPWEGQRGV